MSARETKRSMLDQAETIQLWKFMEPLIEVLGEGQCRYRDKTHTDEAVARAFSAAHFSVTSRNVEGLRGKLFGEIAKPDSEVDRLAKLEERVLDLAAPIKRVIEREAALEARIAAQDDRIRMLESRVDLLVEQVRNLEANTVKKTQTQLPLGHIGPNVSVATPLAEVRKLGG